MKHRTLHVDKFLSVVEPVPLQRFLEQHGVPTDDAVLLSINPDAFEAYFNEPAQVQVGGEVYEELQRVNDLSEASLPFVTNEYRRAQISFSPNLRPEALALHLYLEHPAAFEAAWSNFVLFGTTVNLCSYHLCCGLTVSVHEVAAFSSATQRYFQSLDKGDECYVSRADNDLGVVLRIVHGTYLHTAQHWLKGAIEFTTLRPAKEDILFYETRTGLLHIRATSAPDGDAYLQLFAEHIAGDPNLAAAAAHQPLYTLLPLRLGTFCFDGNGSDVLRVEFRHARLRLVGSMQTVLKVNSPNVRESFTSELAPLSLAAGDVLEVGLRFHVWPRGGRKKTLTVTVKPPARTYLTQAKFSEIVDRYLEEQGVRIA